MTAKVIVIGGGFAGAEAAWQAAERGIDVALYEMRPARGTPAHKTGDLAELVCSNSLKADSLATASGLLKAELRVLGSLILQAADAHRVPAGIALAVDREGFAQEVTRRVLSHPRISVLREEVRAIPEGDPVILATGPLTSTDLARGLAALAREEYLYFYDAISPIVDGETIDYDRAFFASRYGKGGDDGYLNLGLPQEEYRAFRLALVEAEKVPLHPFEEARYFEGCLPVEVLAERGEETLAFGPMKPVGLADPKTGRRFHAVVQLRRENAAGSAYNMVGFQTKLTHPEQRRVFHMLPGLERAAFFRYGSVHRNTFLNAPRLLSPSLQMRGLPRLFIAGQITGVEGYLESAAMGLLAGLNAAARVHGLSLPPPPPTTALGALVGYITQADPRDFQPANIHYGLLPPAPGKGSREDRRRRVAERALRDLEPWRKFLLSD
ncbi:MAG: methylenetetrahydrofolate--tRNA-(uracil(54)-C(5))-methyltransferase (FADH(2)-oxidizing) TrmFO [Candidatus Tectomicrobia bacterium]|nr:methylenetetrahydrofolate--tRNA-(uracil(54)-C(5))-methyltransferase (FADH(2)-oxidizing) TrmFO [Candidatus Tectomicrobia bacterium]